MYRRSVLAIRKLLATMPMGKPRSDMDLIETDETGDKIRKLYFSRLDGVDQGYLEMVEPKGSTHGYKADNYGLISAEAALARFHSG